MNSADSSSYINGSHFAHGPCLQNDPYSYDTTIDARHGHSYLYELPSSHHPHPCRHQQQQQQQPIAVPVDYDLPCEAVDPDRVVGDPVFYNGAAGLELSTYSGPSGAFYGARGGGGGGHPHNDRLGTEGYMGPHGVMPGGYSTYYPSGDQMAASSNDGPTSLFSPCNQGPGVHGGTGYCGPVGSGHSNGNDLHLYVEQQLHTTKTFKWLTIKRNHPKTAAG